MRIVTYLIVGITALSIGCGKTSHDHPQHDIDSTQTTTTSSKYDQVMKLHDEGMAKMDEMYKLKKELQEKIKSSKDLVQEKKEKMESTILKLDSAHKGMMNWMREFQPKMDSLKDSSYQYYLDAELEKVKKVKEDIFAAIEEAAKDNAAAE